MQRIAIIQKEQKEMRQETREQLQVIIELLQQLVGSRKKKAG